MVRIIAPRGGKFAVPLASVRACAAAASARRASIFMRGLAVQGAVIFPPTTGEDAITCARVAASIGPIWLLGGESADRLGQCSGAPPCGRPRKGMSPPPATHDIRIASQCRPVVGRLGFRPPAQRLWYAGAKGAAARLQPVCPNCQHVIGHVHRVLVTKYTPTPWTGSSRATCSTIVVQAFGRAARNSTMRFHRMRKPLGFVRGCRPSGFLGTIPTAAYSKKVHFKAAGLPIRRSACRMLITPCAPRGLCASDPDNSNAGSEKEMRRTLVFQHQKACAGSRQCWRLSHCRSAPKPSARCSPRWISTARRSSRSRIGNPSSSGNAKGDVNNPFLRFCQGPASATAKAGQVRQWWRARGWPCSPKKSHRMVGLPAKW